MGTEWAVLGALCPPHPACSSAVLSGRAVSQRNLLSEAGRHQEGAPAFQVPRRLQCQMVEAPAASELGPAWSKGNGMHPPHREDTASTKGRARPPRGLGQSRPGLGIMRRCLSDAVMSADREEGEDAPPSVRMAQENTQSRRPLGDPNVWLRCSLPTGPLSLAGEVAGGWRATTFPGREPPRAVQRTRRHRRACLSEGPAEGKARV